MSILLTLTIAIVFLLIGKLLLSKWFNHVTIYTIIWSTMIILYELKLMPFVPLKTETWQIVIATYILFIGGVLTIIAARSYAGKNNNISSFSRSNYDFVYINEKHLKWAIIFISFIGLLNAIHHWNVLITEFGSVLGVILNATKYYRMRVGGEIEGVLPYLYIISYVGVFLSGIYTAIKGKLNLIGVLPILIIVIREVANLGRAGILFGLLEFVITFLLFRHYLSNQNISNVRNSKRNLLLAVLVIVTIAVSGAVIVKSVRNPIDNFKGTSQSLKSYEGSSFISPSIYLYACSHIGVLNKYLQGDGEDNYIGENTFLPLYNFLSKFNVVEHPNFFQKGYYIPMWTNTGTYLREIKADFGIIGLFLIPYMLGLITTFYWFKFYETGKYMYLLILTYLYLIISFSFLVMVTRLSTWFISFTILVSLLSFIEKFTRSKKYKNPQIEIADS